MILAQRTSSSRKSPDSSTGKAVAKLGLLGLGGSYIIFFSVANSNKSLSGSAEPSNRLPRKQGFEMGLPVLKQGKAKQAEQTPIGAVSGVSKRQGLQPTAQDSLLFALRALPVVQLWREV